MQEAEITIFAVFAKWSMLITRAVLCLLTHLLFLLIGYLLAKDFQQNYHLHLMRKQGSPHRKVIAECLIKSCLEHVQKNHQERKSREICFYFCTDNNVTLLFAHIRFNLSNSNLEPYRFSFPLSVKEKDYFKDWEVFLLSCENEPVTSNTPKKDFSHLRTIVRHQVPLPLITNRDGVSGDIIKELYRIRKLPVEREFSVLQKYPRAINCVLSHLSNFENLSAFLQYYHCLCLNESNKEIYFTNPLCKYKLSVYRNKLFSILCETERIREDKRFDKCGIIVTECKYFNELSKFIEHYLFRQREIMGYAAVRTNTNTFERVAAERNGDILSYDLKRYFQNLSTYKNITQLLGDGILISDKKELNKGIFSKQTNKKRRNFLNKFYKDNIINKLFSKHSFSSPSKRERRQVSNSKNRSSFKKLISKVKYGNKFLENSSKYNSSDFHTSKKLSPPSLRDNDFLEKLKVKNSFPRFQKFSFPDEIREQKSRSKKSLISLGSKSRTGKETTISTYPILEEEELNPNSRQRASTKSPQQSNKFGNPFKTEFAKESNATGIININLKETIDAKVNTTKHQLDVSPKNKTSFQIGSGNSKRNLTSSTDQLVIYRNSNTTAHNSEEKQIKNVPITLEQRDNSQSNINRETDEFNYSTTSEFGLTRDKLPDGDDASLKSELSTKIRDTSYTGYVEAVSLGKDIFPVSEISDNIPETYSDLALTTEKLVKTVTNISPKVTKENSDMSKKKTSKKYNTDDITDNPFQFPNSIQEPRGTTSNVKKNIDSILTYRPPTEDNSAVTDIEGILSSEDSMDSIPSKRFDYDGSTGQDFTLTDNTFSIKTVTADFMTTEDTNYNKLFTTFPYNLMTTTSTIQNDLHERNYASLPSLEEGTFSSKDEGKDYVTKRLPTTNLEFSTNAVKDESKYFDVIETTTQEITPSSKDDGNDYISEDLLVSNIGFSTGLIEDESKYIGVTETTAQEITPSSKDDGNDYISEDLLVSNVGFSTGLIEDESKYIDVTETTTQEITPSSDEGWKMMEMTTLTSEDDGNDYISEDLLVSNMGFSTGLIEDESKYIDVTETTTQEITPSSKDDGNDYISEDLLVSDIGFSTGLIEDESKYIDVTETTTQEITPSSKDDGNDYISEDLLVSNIGFSTGLREDDAAETTRQEIISPSKDEGKYYSSEGMLVTKMEFSTDAVEDENKYFDETETTMVTNRALESSSVDFIPKEIFSSTNKIKVFSEDFTEKIITTSDTEAQSTVEMVKPVSYATESEVIYFTENKEKSFLTTTEISNTLYNDENLFSSEDKTQTVTSYIDLKEKETISTSTETFSNVPSLENEKVEDVTNTMQITKLDAKQDNLSTAESINVDDSVKNMTSIYFDENSFSSPEEIIGVSHENTLNSLNDEIPEDFETSTTNDKPNTKTISDSINDEGVYNTQFLSSSDVNMLSTSDVKNIWEQDEVSEMTEREFFSSSERDLSVSMQESETDETSLKTDTGTFSSPYTTIPDPFTSNAELSSYKTSTSEKTIASPSDYDIPLQTEDFDLSLENVSNPVEIIISSTDDKILSGDITQTEIEMLFTKTETENILSSEKNVPSSADETTDVEEETLIRTDRDVISVSEEYASSLSDETSKPSNKEMKTTLEDGRFSSSDYSTFLYFEENGFSKDDNDNDISKTSTDRELFSSSDDKSVILNEMWTISSNNTNTEGMEITPEKELFPTEDSLSPDRQGLESSSLENEILKISSENDLISSSDDSSLTSDKTITDTLADDYDKNLIPTDSELFTSIDDKSSPDDYPFSENVILSQDEKTTSLKEIIRTEREILSSSEDTVPFSVENENKKGIISPVTSDISTIKNYPTFLTENNLNSGISDISPGLTNENGVSDISFESKGGVNVDVNKGISTEFNFKTPIQTIPFNEGGEENTELNIIEKTSSGDDVLNVSNETLSNDVDLSVNTDVLSTPNITLSNINPKTEETVPGSTENEENTPIIYLSPIAPKSTDETDYDSESVSEGTDNAEGLITTPRTLSTIFEQYSSSTSTSEKNPETSTTKESVPATASSGSGEQFSSTISLTSVISRTSTVTISSTTIPSSLKPSTIELVSSVKPSKTDAPSSVQSSSTEVSSSVKSSTSESSSSVKPSTTKSSSSVKPLFTAMPLPESSSAAEMTSSANIAEEATIPTDATPISFHFTIDADYDEVIGSRKKEFEESLTKQLVVAMRIPFECLQNLQVSKGSVNVNFELVPSPDHGHMADEKALKAAADELKRMIDNGQLNINDLDGNTLVVVPMDPPTKAPVVNQKTTLILGVIIGAFVLTVISVAIAAIIIKRKANGGHRLTPIEEMRSKLPSYREIPFQEALFVKESTRNKLMYGKYCYNTGKWLGPGPEPVPFHPPDSAVYRPPTDSAVRKTPRPPTAVRERLRSDWELDWDSMVSTR